MFESALGMMREGKTHLQASAHSGLTIAGIWIDIYGSKYTIPLTDRLLGTAIHESFQRCTIDLHRDTMVGERPVSTAWQGMGERNVTD